MKTIHYSLQPIAYRVGELELADYGGVIRGLRVRETKETIFHMDFAILLNGVWHEGRCYGVPEARELNDCYLMTTGDSQRIPLQAGMSIRLPCYTIPRAQLLQLAGVYLQELGFQLRSKGQLLQSLQQLPSPGFVDVRFSVAPPRSSVTVTVRLDSAGGITILADTEDFSVPTIEGWL